MIPMLNVITSETSASSGISIPSSRCGCCERLGQHRAPLGVHAREALAQVRIVPGERLQLEPDLLVGDVLADEVAHRRPPLLDERHVGRVQLALARDQPLGEPLERAHEQVLVRAEVVVDEAVVDAGLLGEPARRDAGVADVDEQPLGRVEERLLGRGAGRRLVRRLRHVELPERVRDLPAVAGSHEVHVLVVDRGADGDAGDVARRRPRPRCRACGRRRPLSRRRAG